MTNVQPAILDVKGMRLVFASKEEAERVGALVSEEVPCNVEGNTLRFHNMDQFARGVEEAEIYYHVPVQSRPEERIEWIHSLHMGPYNATLLRGERPIRTTGYASDPGDLGAGRYFTSNKYTAQNYGKVGKHEVAFTKAAFVGKNDLNAFMDHVMLFYRTIRGKNRMAGADLMRSDMLKAGVEGLVCWDYDSGPGHVTVVDYRSTPPRPHSESR